MRSTTRLYARALDIFTEADEHVGTIRFNQPGGTVISAEHAQAFVACMVERWNATADVAGDFDHTDTAAENALDTHTRPAPEGWDRIEGGGECMAGVLTAEQSIRRWNGAKQLGAVRLGGSTPATRDGHSVTRWTAFNAAGNGIDHWTSEPHTPQY